MPMVTFVVSPRQDYAVRDLAEMLGSELELQGVPCALSLDGFPRTGEDPAPVPVLVDPFSWSLLEGRDALPGDGVLRRTAFVGAEPPPGTGDEDHRALLARAGVVFCTSQRSVVAMHRLGIRARLLRPGYSRSRDHFHDGVRRPIDVLVLGTGSERRRAVVAQAARVLHDAKLRVEMPDVTPTAAEVDGPLAGGRWELLSMAKVLLVVHGSGGDSFPWSLVLDAIHAGTVVVSEHSAGIAPLVPGEHLFCAAAGSLADVCAAVLADEARLVRVRSDAYCRVRDWVPAALWVSVLRAAVVELVGEPWVKAASS